MGYSNIVEVELVLAQSLSSGRPNGSGQKFNIINSTSTDQLALNRIPDEVLEFHINLADAEINGALTQMYKIPLKKCVQGQWTLDADINEYNQIVEVSDAYNLVPGQEIIIRNDDTGDEEQHIINQVIDQYSFTVVDNIVTEFSGSEVRVMRIDHPPPINLISARLAAASIYDKYFSAQNDPNISEYGKELRLLASGQINDILNGRTTLECQERIGDIFASPYIDSRYSLRELPQSFNSNAIDRSRPR